MRTIVFISLFFLSCHLGQAQVFIGKEKDTVKELMKGEREFALDVTSKNTVYNTLKYVDNMQTRTYLFLFDENDTCTLSKLMCDYKYLNRIIKKLDEKYVATEEGQWTYNEDGKKYLITLKKGDWFFSVITKKAE